MFLIGPAWTGAYGPNGGDILQMLGFVGDLAQEHLLPGPNHGWGAAAHATADYGKTFVIVAGLLNFIAAADAHHIALGKKP
jgi:hypothetical protein